MTPDRLESFLTAFRTAASIHPPKARRCHRRRLALALGVLVTLAGCRSVTAPPPRSSPHRLTQAPESPAGVLVQDEYDANPYFAPVAGLSFAQGATEDTLTVIWSASPAAFTNGRHLWLSANMPLAWRNGPDPGVGVDVSADGVAVRRYDANGSHAIAGSVVTVANRTTFTFPASEAQFFVGWLVAEAYYWPAGPGGEVTVGYWHMRLAEPA